MNLIKPLKMLIVILITMSLLIKPALAFCGFYVAKADTTLYNQASQVIIAREGDRTILTMANDYQGEVKDFALVVPVPVVLKQDQVNVGKPQIIEKLDTFSAPRLVEYFDSDPCAMYDRGMMPESDAFPAAPPALSMEKTRRNEALGVTVEEAFTVGEYDIVILSAKESDGLEIWLNENGYKIPRGASQLLQPYIRDKMKFFVARVNLEEYNKTGFNKLRPLKMAFESPKFMLPIRLGMINAQKAQDLIIYLLTPKGEVELTNYRSVKVPSNVDIPEFVQREFGEFYQAMFDKVYNREGQKVGFVEYAWDMGGCDPCVTDPLNPEELREAGVFWDPNRVFITRLHVRYTRDKFPEDLRFQETGNTQLFQGRYVIRHPYKGEMKCDAAQEYVSGVKRRQEQEAQTLASLTGWDIKTIRSKIDFVKAEPTPWWRRVFN
jgi:hypothetical protein